MCLRCDNAENPPIDVLLKERAPRPGLEYHPSMGPGTYFGEIKQKKAPRPGLEPGT